MTPEVIPTRTTNVLMLYIVALVSVAALVTGTIVASSYFAPDKDNTAIIIGFGVMILATVPPIISMQVKVQETAHLAKQTAIATENTEQVARQAVAVAEKTGKAVDGKMTQFENVLRELMREQADKLRAEGQAEVARTEVATARAEGQIAGAEAAYARTDDLAARPPAQPAAPLTITNGDKPVDVRLVPGHKVADEEIKPPGTEKP